jgi:hypothetical protein
VVAVVATAIGGCAYKAEPIAAANYNVVMSYGQKIPGKWLLYSETVALNQTVKPSGLSCSAHKFPLELAEPFKISTLQTLRNVLADVQPVDAPQNSDQLKAQGAKGLIVVRGQEVRPRLDIQAGFWSANMRTEVLIVASVTVDGLNGRLFGQTVEGQGVSDADAGFACEGGAKSLSDSAATATRDTVRKVAEAIGNSERLREIW